LLWCVRAGVFRDIALEHSLKDEAGLPGAEPSYAVRVSGFASDVEPRAYVGILRVALAWLLLQHDIAADAVFEIQDLPRIKELGGLPVNVDGNM
jgi:hypothetical protein